MRLPGDVEVIALVDHLLRSGASGGDSLGPGGSRRSAQYSRRCSKVHGTADEVERVRDASHAAVPLRSATSRSNPESRMDSQEADDMQCDVATHVETSSELTG